MTHDLWVCTEVAHRTRCPAPHARVIRPQETCVVPHGSWGSDGRYWARTRPSVKPLERTEGDSPPSTQGKDHSADDDDDPLPATDFHSAFGQPLDSRESNPRRGSAQIESEEDPDLATDGASDSAPKAGHKHLGRKGSKPSDLPFIHPGQMALFGRDFGC